MSDGSEVLNEFLVVHSNTSVGYRQCLGFFIGGDFNAEFEVGFEDIFFSELFQTHFLQCIGGV